MDEEKNKALEEAANALNAAAEAEAPVEKPEEKTEEKPINEETSAAMDALLAEEDAPKAPEDKPAEPVGEMKEEPAIEPAPAAPLAAPEAQPVAPASPVVNETPVETPANSDIAAVANKPEKKSKKGLIIGIAAGAVVALGAGGFGIAYAISNQPENIAMAAVADFLSSKQMAITGTMELKTVQDDQTKCSGGYNTKCVSYTNPLESVKLTITDKKDASNDYSTEATLDVVYDGKNYSLSLGTVVLKDYVLYVKLSGLKETVKQAIQEAKDSGSDYIEVFEDIINGVVSSVDDVWWKIDVPNVIDSLEDMTASAKKEMKAVYQCTIDTINKAYERQDKYVDIYKSNAFVSLEEYKGDKKSKAKGTPYKLKLDAGKLTSYFNTMTGEVQDLGYGDCLKNAIPSIYVRDYSDEEVKQENVEKSLEDFPEIIVIVDNGLFSHRLSGIYYSNVDESYDGYIDIVFDKDVKEFGAPAGAKEASELIDIMTKAYDDYQDARETASCLNMKANYPTYYSTYCDPVTNKYRTDNQNLL